MNEQNFWVAFLSFLRMCLYIRKNKLTHTVTPNNEKPINSWLRLGFKANNIIKKQHYTTAMARVLIFYLKLYHMFHLLFL